MGNFAVLALASFVAQLIDGALGMGYGVTSTSMLLAVGLAPAMVSASVHAGEVVTTLVSGLSHWRFGNVNFEMTWRLALPGAAGAFAGALFLSSLPVHVARPAVAGFLILLGVVVLVRSLRPQRARPRPKPLSPRLLTPLGLAAGFLDATGGGGWGPVATSTLAARHGDNLRQVIGSVDASEFLVALSATAGFFLALGWEGVNPTWVAAIVLGGAVAAPLAAWAVRVVPAQTLGVAVGATIVLSNGNTVLSAFGVHTPPLVLLALIATPTLIALAGARLTQTLRANSRSQ